MLRQLKNNKEGIVLVVVLMVVLTMMVIVLSIISLRTSAIKITETEVLQIQSELLAKGTLAYVIANRYAGGNALSYTFQDELYNRIYYTEVTYNGLGVNINGILTNTLKITVSY